MISGEASRLVRTEFKTLTCLIDNNKRAVPLSDLSESVKQLQDAWGNDMQLFLSARRNPHHHRVAGDHS